MNWKIAGFFGAFGFVVSLIAGIFGGVGFGMILLRSLAAGVVFGGLGIGITYAVKRFLPELMEPGGSGPSASDGGGIDIVLEAEEPVSNRENAAPSVNDEKDEDFIEEIEEVRDEDSSDPLLRTGASNDEDLTELEDVSEGIDSLPDIGELADRFSGSESADADRETTANGYSGGAGYTGGGLDSLGSGGKGNNVLGSDVDPQTVAKAIKTIMKKDE